MPDDSNPYLQSSPGYSRARWYVSGSPYLKTTPPENSLAGKRYCGTQAINKSCSTSLSSTPYPRKAWMWGQEIILSVLGQNSVFHRQKEAYTTPPWLPSFLGKIKLNGDGMGNFTSFLCPDIFIAVIMTSHWPLDGARVPVSITG
jgi:hypothetical protein